MEVERCERKLSENNDELPANVEESIKKIINKEGYTDYNRKTKAISTLGGNYFGSLYEVDVTGKLENGEEKETNIFVKGIVPGDHVTFLSVTGMFNMELFFYNDLALMLDEIQNEANVPMKERYNHARTYEESIHEAIIMENLTRKGYKTLYRMDVTPIKYVELCMIQLGRLHGLSFALENKRPDYFNDKIKPIDCPFTMNHDLKSLLTSSAKLISNCLDEEARVRFNAFVPQLWDRVKTYFFDQRYKKTIVHGDWRPNNILMKEIDGDVIDVIPVDYQMLYYGCPLYDFFFYIYLGTDQHFRKRHLEDLKNLYFDSIAKMLRYFNIDIEVVFPRLEFEELYKEVSCLGLHSFMNLMPFVFAAEGAHPDTDTDVEHIVIKTDPRINERARGIVDDYMQWGVL